MIQNSPRHPGFLVCDECGTLWCEHIEEFVKNMEDAEFIWDISVEREIKDIKVPIVPTANVWQEVELTPDPGGKKNKLVYLKPVDHLFFSDDVFIGFINPGEGRLVLREMLLDWFIGTVQQRIEEHKCKAPGHGYHQTIRWNEDIKAGGGRELLQHWSVWTTGRCLGCTFDQSNKDKFIPDVAPNSPWNR